MSAMSETSLVKYENPVLISRSTDKKSTRVSLHRTALSLLCITTANVQREMAFCYIVPFLN